MANVLVRHKVKDYDAWKPVFDSDADNRKQHGSQGARIFRNADDPTELFILFDWDSHDNARPFPSSPELGQKMQAAGVMDRPDFYFVDEVASTPE